jgi:hypothetical protein
MSAERDAILSALAEHDLEAHVCECALGPHIVRQCSCGETYTNAHLADVLTTRVFPPGLREGGE